MNGNRIRPSRRDSAGGGQSSSSKRRNQKLLTSRKSNDLFVGDEDEELPTTNRLHIDTNAQSIQHQYSNNKSSRRKPKHASAAMKNVLQSKLSKSKNSTKGQGAPSYAQERSNMNESISTKSTSRNNRNSRNKQRSTTSRGGSSTKPATSNQQHSSPTDGIIDIIIGGETNTSTKIQNTPKSTPRQIKPSYTTATSSSTNSSIIQQQSTSTTLSPRDNNSTRTQTDLQTRRRNPIQIIQTINSEDGNIECDIPHLDSNIVDTSIVYTNKFRGSMGLLDIEKLNLKEEEFIDDLDASSTTSTNGTNREDERSSTLGNNGWHRALNVITTSSTTNDISPRSNAIEISSPNNNNTSTLDQLTVTHLLQNVHPQIDEYDAIYEEYTHLKSEIKALELDRIELEKQFHKASKVISQEKLSNESNKLSYQTFRTNLRYMKRDDIKTLPVLWLEDVQLTSNEDSSSRRSNKLDTKFQQQIRNYRGTNLALLISDKQCKTSLIGRTCSLSNINTESLSNSGSSMLQRMGSATLIDGGGELLNHVAITGYDDKTSTSKSAKDIFNKSKNESMGTTYFLKFDNGKTHHRGNLPSNLLARLYRERKEYTSIKYLSTGCTYSIGNGHRCYYCEFDTGECWWGTNKDDMLDDAFMSVDVHRVAFGGSSSNKESSSWIVIGKDGSVKWKNVPQGLHDLLMKHMATTSNSKEGLLSPTFLSVNPATPKSTAVCPCEVSLGIGGTYFIRFIDGSFDYSLPNFVADVVDKFESDGRLIRNVSLHIETYDCLIRYSNEMLEC